MRRRPPANATGAHRRFSNRRRSRTRAADHRRGALLGRAGAGTPAGSSAGRRHAGRPTTSPQRPASLRPAPSRSSCRRAARRNARLASSRRRRSATSRAMSAQPADCQISEGPAPVKPSASRDQIHGRRPWFSHAAHGGTAQVKTSRKIAHRNYACIAEAQCSRAAGFCRRDAATSAEGVAAGSVITRAKVEHLRPPACGRCRPWSSPHGVAGDQPVRPRRRLAPKPACHGSLGGCPRMTVHVARRGPVSRPTTSRGAVGGALPGSRSSARSGRRRCRSQGRRPRCDASPPGSENTPIRLAAAGVGRRARARITPLPSRVVSQVSGASSIAGPIVAGGDDLDQAHVAAG